MDNSMTGIPPASATDERLDGLIDLLQDSELGKTQLYFHERNVSDEYFNLYFGWVLVKEDNHCGIGFVMSDSTNFVLVKACKSLLAEEVEESEMWAGLQSLKTGLQFAIDQGIRKLNCHYIDPVLHQHLNGQKEAAKVFADLIVETIGLSTQFDHCQLVPAVDMSIVGLAQDLANYSISILENCEICWEVIHPHRMTNVGECGHRYCKMCMESFIQSKLQEKQLLKCPAINCAFDMDPLMCFTAIPLKLHPSLFELLKLTHTPVSDRIYCPNPLCSNLMSSKAGFGPSENEDIPHQCGECGSLLCVNCRMPWNDHLVSCDPYVNDPELNDLATHEGWQRCPQCSSLIERTEGCPHVMCRCGQEFCYLCGLEWRNCQCTGMQIG